MSLLGPALTVGLAFATGSVNAVILTEKSAEQKQRKDIGKQGAKHALYMAKAAIKCEENGIDVAPECDHSAPGMSTGPDPQQDHCETDRRSGQVREQAEAT